MNNFYANLPNTSRNQFQFDKVYPNRMSMDASAQTDEVFVGRYVLIEYDTKITESFRIRAYRNDEDFQTTHYLYTSATNFSSSTIVKYTSSVDLFIDPTRPYNISRGIYKGVVVYVVEEDQSLTFYQCSGREGMNALFQPITYDANYMYNFLQDKNYAASSNLAFGKGWDSTVWLKVYAGGQSKYIMIAELNVSMPVLNLSIDAPSISPVPPHFDEHSNNQYYTLHQQSPWGFRIKSAHNNITGPKLDANGNFESDILLLRATYQDMLSYPSDVKTVWYKQEYDQTTDNLTKQYFVLPNANSQDGTWIDEKNPPSAELLSKAKEGIPAAIYFNKDGFQVNKIVKSEDLFTPRRLNKFNYVSSETEWPEEKINDSIQLVPTGLSGHTYYSHNNNYSLVPDIDTYELSIMLPSIGDAISHMWDLIYGGRETNSTISLTSLRNTDISWEDASIGGQKNGLRLFKLQNNQYNYQEAEVNTLAGSINTAHDIMGMIIHDTSGTGLNLSQQSVMDNLSSNLIYFHGGSFYRKRKYYDYVRPSDPSDVHTFKEININFDENAIYYDKIASNYLIYRDTPEKGKYLYTLEEEPVSLGTFSDTYKPYVYFYKSRRSDDPNSSWYNTWDYFIEANAEPSSERTYVSLNKFDEDGYIIEEWDEEGNPLYHPYGRTYYFYEPGTYYYFESEDAGQPIQEEEEPVPAEEDHIIYTRKYYIKVESYYFNKTLNRYEITITYSLISNDSFMNFELGKYYRRINDNYIAIIQQPDGGEPVECYVLPYVSEDVFFFQSGKYYYTNNGNWLLDNNPKYTVGREYFMPPVMEGHNDLIFYIPGIYYYGPDEQHLTKDSKNGTYDSSKRYWEKLNRYVVYDPNEVLDIGSLWNDGCEVPEGVEINNVVERWGIEELPELFDGKNTMLGLILQMKAFLDVEHSDTRDLKTVQGSINVLNDIIKSFAYRSTGQLMITNNYGQIAGATLSSAQRYQYTNLKTGNTSTLTANTDGQWIKHEVNPVYSGPQIILKHTLVSENSHAATSTTSALNLNTSDTSTIDLYMPIVDLAGHVVGQNTETVTLPYSFQTISVTNSTSTSAAANTINANGQAAETLKDTLILSASNKWIKLDNNTSKTIKFGHLLSGVSAGSYGPNEDLSLSLGDTFVIPGITVDAAGHVTGLIDYEITLPDIEIPENEIPPCEAEEDGTYILKCTIEDGEKIYEWVEET